jgi:hypothetical protein
MYRLLRVFKKEESSSDFGCDLWTIDEWLDKALNTNEESRSKEIKEVFENLNKINKIVNSRKIVLSAAKKQEIQNQLVRLGSIWDERKIKIEEEKELSLQSVKENWEIAEKFNTENKIDDDVFKRKIEEKTKILREEIELEQIEFWKSEFLQEIDKYIQQLVKNDFELVKDNLTGEQIQEINNDIEDNLYLKNLKFWVNLDSKIKKDLGFGDYLSIKKTLTALFIKIRQLGEEKDYLTISNYSKELKEQKKLILLGTSQRERTKILLEEFNIDQEIQKLDQLMVNRLRIDIEEKISQSLKNSNVIINEGDINTTLGVEDYHEMIKNKNHHVLSSRKFQEWIINTIEETKKIKKNLITNFLGKWNNPTYWQGEVLFCDLAKELEYLNFQEIPNQQNYEQNLALKYKKIENFFAWGKNIFEKTDELLCQMENINDNTTWQQLQKIKNQLDNQLFNEQYDEKKSNFIQRLLQTNGIKFTNYHKILWEKIQSYTKIEKKFVERIIKQWKENKKDLKGLNEFEESLKWTDQWTNKGHQQKWLEISNNWKAFTDLEKDLSEAKEVQDLSNLVQLDQLEESEKKLENWLSTNDPYKTNTREHNSERIKEEKEKIHSLHETYKNLTTELVKDSKSLVELEEIKRNLEEWQNPADNEELKKLVSQNWAKIIQTRLNEINKKITETQEAEKEEIINVLLTGKTATLSSLVIISLLISSLLWWKRKALESLLLSNRKPVVALSPWLNCQHCDEAMEIWQEKNLIVNCGGCSN